ncbi:MAG: beta-phosphoglucomutase family hydrolase, partial [Hyphomicrobiaceae bacterium]
MKNHWLLRYDRFEPQRQGTRETLCTLGNGYFATRGAPTDAVADGVHYPATYLAGGYNRLQSQIDGRTVENEDLVNLPNWLPLQVRIADGPWIRTCDLEQLEYNQELDLKCGVLHRRVRVRDADGRILLWRERRIVSMASPHRAAVEVTLVAENWSGRLVVRSSIDGAVRNAGVARYNKLASKHLETIETRQTDDKIILLNARMIHSRRELAIAARTRVHTAGQPLEPDCDSELSKDTVSQILLLEVQVGEAVIVEKTVAIFDTSTLAISEPVGAALTELANCGHFNELAEA